MLHNSSDSLVDSITGHTNITVIMARFSSKLLKVLIVDSLTDKSQFMPILVYLTASARCSLYKAVRSSICELLLGKSSSYALFGTLVIPVEAAAIV